jgi:outer membrane protein OmpA-like peptidoglycan-associated protein
MTIARDFRRLAAIVIAAAAVTTAGCQSAHPYRGPLIQAVTDCADFTVPIYFEPGSARVTGDAAALIAAARRHGDACLVTGIRVTGLADAPGSPDENLRLSKNRADAVTRALARQGFTQVEFHVAAAGAAGATTQAGQDRPLRRRAVVEFHLTAKAPPSPR